MTFLCINNIIADWNNIDMPITYSHFGIFLVMFSDCYDNSWLERTDEIRSIYLFLWLFHFQFVMWYLIGLESSLAQYFLIICCPWPLSNCYAYGKWIIANQSEILPFKTNVYKECVNIWQKCENTFPMNGSTWTLSWMKSTTTTKNTSTLGKKSAETWLLWNQKRFDTLVLANWKLSNQLQLIEKANQLNDW